MDSQALELETVSSSRPRISSTLPGLRGIRVSSLDLTSENSALLDHQEFQSEDDPPDTSDDKPNRYHAHTHHGTDGGGLFTNPPDPPKAASPAPQSPNDSKRWYKDRKYVLELLAFLVLFVYTIFSGLQWLQIRWTNGLTREALNGSNLALDRTLRKMDWQIQETHEIAKQSLAQAQQTARLADDTHDLAKAAGEQSKATAKIATATDGEVRTMQTQLEFNQRAWIRFADLKPLSDLTFESDGVHLRFGASYINIGNLPATNVSVQADVVFEHWGRGNGGIEEISAIQKSVCERASSAFPESKNDSVLMYPGPPVRDFDDSTITPTKDIDFNSFQGSEMRVLQPIIVGCISYKFLSSPKIHRTGFIVEVKRKTANPNFPQPLFTKERIPMNEIQMTEYYFAGKILD